MEVNSKKICIFFFILFNAVNIFSQHYNYEQNFKFATELMARKEYYRAITEFYRINSYYPEKIDKVNIQTKIAECFYLGGHFREALDIYMVNLKKDQNNLNSRYWAARIFAENRKFRASLDVLDSNIISGELESDSINLIIAYNNLGLHRYESSISYLSKIGINSEYYDKAQQNTRIIKSETPLRYKNKSTAILLNSFIPGAGYYYAGNPKTGLTAFLCTVISAGGAYYGFKNNQEGWGVFSSICFLTFYSGSTYGCIQETEKYNKRLFNSLLDKIKFF